MPNFIIWRRRVRKRWFRHVWVSTELEEWVNKKGDAKPLEFGYNPAIHQSWHGSPPQKTLDEGRLIFNRDQALINSIFSLWWWWECCLFFQQPFISFKDDSIVWSNGFHCPDKTKNTHDLNYSKWQLICLHLRAGGWHLSWLLSGWIH